MPDTKPAHYEDFRYAVALGVKDSDGIVAIFRHAHHARQYAKTFGGEVMKVEIDFTYKPNLPMPRKARRH